MGRGLTRKVLSGAIVTTADLKHSNLTDKLINTFYSLYNELGYGFLESVYQKAFALMLKGQGLLSGNRLPFALTFTALSWVNSWPIC